MIALDVKVLASRPDGSVVAVAGRIVRVDRDGDAWCTCWRRGSGCDHVDAAAAHLGLPAPPRTHPGPLAPVDHRTTAWAALSAIVDAGPPAGSMRDLESALRALHRLAALVELAPRWLPDDRGVDALHRGLHARGARHVGELRRAELEQLTRAAWEAVAKDLTDHDHLDEEQPS